VQTFSALQPELHLYFNVSNDHSEAPLITKWNYQTIRHLAFGCQAAQAPRRQSPATFCIRLLRLPYLQQALATKLEPSPTVATIQAPCLLEAPNT
jgi:hypothetical protein